jgi:hypothetical protein
MGSMEDSEALDTDGLEAVSSADELIPDTIEDGASSTKDEETIDGVGNGVEVSEDVNGSTEAGTVEEARSPSWDNGGGVLDTEEASAESDSVAMGARKQERVRQEMPSRCRQAEGAMWMKRDRSSTYPTRKQ